MKKVIHVILMGGLWLALMAACGRDAEPEVMPTPTPVILAQWAVGAQASSAYGLPDWSARRATGAPDVNVCGDDPRAWASARGNGLEWLELSYAEPVYATEVRIYQTLGRGAVARVHLRDESGESHLVWEGTDTDDTCPGVLRLSFPRVTYRVAGVRIELDESRTGFWNQVDAVELIGVQ
ncbi:MAG: hypothetical protein J7M17_02795 [Anaerolineae bacterium]|nr:hypothetical protein [Anaerolineae bacterium]